MRRGDALGPGDLGARLQELGSALAFPPLPDVAGSVRERLPDRAASGRRARRAPPGAWRIAWVPAGRRTLVVAMAAVVLLAGVAMAIPGSRHAILRALGLRGVRVERVSRLPAVPRGQAAALGLGTPIPLAHARDAAGFAALVVSGPRAAGARAYLAHDVPGGRISLLIGSQLVTEFRGRSIPFVYKLIGPRTRVTRLRIDGDAALYLSGAPHEVLFEGGDGTMRTDRVRLVGNVLLWQHGAVSVRIEGTRSEHQALGVARSLLPSGAARSLLPGGAARGRGRAPRAVSSGGAGSTCPVTRPTGPRPPRMALLNFSSPIGNPTAHDWYGNGSLWTNVPAAGPNRQGRWLVTKVGWFRAVPGNVHVTGSLLDGQPARFRASTGSSASYGATGSTPSLLLFGQPGCWVVKGRLGRSVLRVVMRVDAPRR